MWTEVLGFLGHHPIPTETLAEEVITYRRQNGLAQEELALQLGVDPTSLGRWERDGEVLRLRDLQRVGSIRFALALTD